MKISDIINEVEIFQFPKKSVRSTTYATPSDSKKDNVIQGTFGKYSNEPKSSIVAQQFGKKNVEDNPMSSTPPREYDYDAIDWHDTIEVGDRLGYNLKSGPYKKDTPYIVTVDHIDEDDDYICIQFTKEEKHPELRGFRLWVARDNENLIQLKISQNEPINEDEVVIPKKIISGYSSYLKNRRRINLLNDADRNNFSRSFSRMGWKEINRGVYSTVYKNPTKSYILKVNHRFDSGYQRYVDFVNEHKNNKYLPKIIAKEFVIKSRKKYYLYFIEKLKYFPKTEVIDLMFEIVEESKFYDTLIAVYNSMSTEQQNLFGKVDKKYPGLLQTTFDIGKYAKNFNIDINEDNVMQRADGTPVITDPYAS